jgi:hypothetical protein
MDWQCWDLIGIICNGGKMRALAVFFGLILAAPAAVFAVPVPDCAANKCPANDPEIHALEGILGTADGSYLDGKSISMQLLYVCVKQCRSGKVLGYVNMDLSRNMFLADGDPYSGVVRALDYRPGASDGEPAYACIDVTSVGRDGHRGYAAIALKGVQVAGQMPHGETYNQSILNSHSGTYGSEHANCREFPGKTFRVSTAGAITGK